MPDLWIVQDGNIYLKTGAGKMCWISSPRTKTRTVVLAMRWNKIVGIRNLLLFRHGRQLKSSEKSIWKKKSIPSFWEFSAIWKIRKILTDTFGRIAYLPMILTPMRRGGITPRLTRSIIIRPHLWSGLFSGMQMRKPPCMAWLKLF